MTEKMIPEDIDTNVISSSEFEKLAQEQAEKILKNIGLVNIKKVPTSDIKTPDYIVDGIAYEVTVLHTYLPEVISMLRWGRELGVDTHVKLYANDQGRLNYEIIYQGECQSNLSILRVRHDISCYRRKIIDKIVQKYEQAFQYHNRIIYFDFRIAPFDSETLGYEISVILQKIGHNFPMLIGMIIGIINSPYKSVIDEPECFFIRNPHTSIQTPSPLMTIEGIPKSTYRIAPMPIITFFKGIKGLNRLTLPPPQFVSVDIPNDF